MREVDKALARAYAQRGVPDHPVVPPAPHLPPRPSEPASRAASEREALDPTNQGDAPFQETVTLNWPSTIKTLEREFGPRFESLADTLIEYRDRQHLKVLLFTSCHRAEGRTSLVLALARALARRPGRTLLVDADLTGPMLARQLGVLPRVGLDDVVENGLALSEALIEAHDDNLTILPLRTPVSRPQEFLSGASWTRLLARLRREFDLVLLDGSPLFAGLSTTLLHQSVDAAILVHNRELTGERAMQRARNTLESGGIPLLGIAETFV